jgi:hypothetical protein
VLKKKKGNEGKNLSKIKNISLVSILTLAIALMVTMIPMLPKANSTGGTGLVANLICPGPAPHRNDPLAGGPQGFLSNPAPPPLPPVPPMVPGPAIAPPYPFAGFIGPSGPQPIFPWSNEGGGVYFGPLFDVYFPFVLYDAFGGGPYVLTGASWTGCDAGCEGVGPNLIVYPWDTDGNGAVENYVRVYARDPGVITLTYGVIDVAVTNVASPKTVVGQGYGLNMTVTSADLGSSSETFNVTAYANTTSIASQNVTLSSGDSANTTFTWNTTGFAYGNYTLNSYAWPVPDETNTTNNNYTCPVPVHVGVPGDVSSKTPRVYDGVTNMFDIAYLVSLYQTRPTSPNWNPNADVNNDGVVDMKDIAIAVYYFNRHE